MDPDGDEIILTQEPPGPYGLRVTEVELTVSDGSLDEPCSSTVTVVDEEAPFVSCNVPPSISPWEVPVSFTATGSDNCSVLRVVVRGATCYRDGGDVHVEPVCDVETEGNTTTIRNAGRRPTALSRLSLEVFPPQRRTWQPRFERSVDGTEILEMRLG